MSRYLLDIQGAGWVNIEDLSKAAMVTKKYLKAITRKSNLFQISGDRLYYISGDEIIQHEKLNGYFKKVRGERVTKRFSEQFYSNKGFTSYITKCFLENDLRKKQRNITKGRISKNRVAKFFNIAKQTAIDNAKCAKVKPIENIKEHRQFKFRNKIEFGVWMTQNMEIEIDGRKISDNPRSFFLKKIDRKNYCLAQRCINIYRFTGVSLASHRRWGSRRKR